MINSEFYFIEYLKYFCENLCQTKKKKKNLKIFTTQLPHTKIYVKTKLKIYAKLNLCQTKIYAKLKILQKNFFNIFTPSYNYT